MLESIIGKFNFPDILYEELVSEAMLAVVKAYPKFDPSKKIKLTTFIHRCVYNHIVSFMKKESRYLRIKAITSEENKMRRIRRGA